jgi:hypothetical protein
VIVVDQTTSQTRSTTDYRMTCDTCKLLAPRGLHCCRNLTAGGRRCYTTVRQRHRGRRVLCMPVFLSRKVTVRLLVKKRFIINCKQTYNFSVLVVLKPKFSLRCFVYWRLLVGNVNRPFTMIHVINIYAVPIWGLPSVSAFRILLSLRSDLQLLYRRPSSTNGIFLVV